ncbi:MAG: 2-dehydropantoate 2-reductase [Aureispira sp.]|nr:2-dehydropantoate 2-reductase [Aureispira sp.]
MQKQPKILVIGAGGIGGVTAGVLAKAGYDIEIICKYEEVAKKIMSTGLEIKGAKGDFAVKMPAKATVPELQEKKDLVLLATKATDMLEPAQQVLPFLKEDSKVVSMQNGFCEEALASVVGLDRTIGCVVGWGATLLKPGVLEMTSDGEFIIGTLDNKKEDQPILKKLQTILNNLVPVEVSQDITGQLYSKLIINSCITSLGAICGLYLGEMLSKKEIREVFINIMREAMVVADGISLQVPVYGGKLDYYKILKGNGWWSNFKRHLLIRIVGMKYKKLKSSSLQSLERGKPTEIDFLNGHIAKKGKECGVPTPVNDLVIETIKEIEQGKRKIGMHNFTEKGFW